MIAILDYGLGNLGSIANMLKAVGEKSKITADPKVIKQADGIILPGVGAFDAGMQRLDETGLKDIVLDYAESRKPILGICLGMQLLGFGSEEGEEDGLGLIPFHCIKFSQADPALKVPHMGWDIVDIKQEHRLVSGFQGIQRYYFVHSFHAACDNTENVLMTCDYGVEFPAAVVKGNIIGVQFHPEKSHNFGMALLRNFVGLCYEEK